MLFLFDSFHKYLKDYQYLHFIWLDDARGWTDRQTLFILVKHFPFKSKSRRSINHVKYLTLYIGIFPDFKRKKWIHFSSEFPFLT